MCVGVELGMVCDTEKRLTALENAMCRVKFESDFAKPKNCSQSCVKRVTHSIYARHRSTWAAWFPLLQPSPISLKKLVSHLNEAARTVMTKDDKFSVVDSKTIAVHNHKSKTVYVHVVYFKTHASTVEVDRVWKVAQVIDTLRDGKTKHISLPPPYSK